MWDNCRCILILPMLVLAACSPYETYVVPTTSIATVLQSTGYPSVLRNSRPYILAEQSIIYPGDRISTDEQSRVQLQLQNGQVLKLSTRSQLLVSPTILDTKIQEFSLSKGSLEFSGNTIGDAHYKVQTTIATASNHLWLAYSRNQNGIDLVSLGEETIKVSNQDGEVTLNTPYQATTILPGAAPQTPLIWSKKKFDELLKLSNRLSR